MLVRVYSRPLVMGTLPGLEPYKLPWPSESFEFYDRTGVKWRASPSHPSLHDFLDVVIRNP